MPNLNVLLNMTHQILGTVATSLRGSAQTVGGTFNSAVKVAATTLCFNGMSLYIFFEDEVGTAQTVIETCGGVIGSACASPSSPVEGLCYSQCESSVGVGDCPPDASLAYDLGANNTLVACVENQIKAALCPPTPLEKDPGIIVVEIIAGVLALAALSLITLKLQKRYCQPKPHGVFFTTSADRERDTSVTESGGDRRALLRPGQ